MFRGLGLRRLGGGAREQTPGPGTARGGEACALGLGWEVWGLAFRPPARRMGPDLAASGIQAAPRHFAKRGSGARRTPALPRGNKAAGPRQHVSLRSASLSPQAKNQTCILSVEAVDSKSNWTLGPLCKAQPEHGGKWGR